MTAEAEEVAARGGGFEEYVLNSGHVNGRYLGIPHGNNDFIAYRISAFEKAGVKHADKGGMDMTWDEYFAVAKSVKRWGCPLDRVLDIA